MLFVLCVATAKAEDGSRLWLRTKMPTDITLRIDSTMPNDDGYRISNKTITARTQLGLLYGKYALLRGEQKEEVRKTAPLLYFPHPGWLTKRRGFIMIRTV